MCPGPTELLFVGCLTELILILKFRFDTLTPRTNSQTYWQREISQVMNGIIFCVCSTSAISVPLIVSKRCRKEHMKMQVKKESQQNQNRWWIWYHDTAWGIRTCLPQLHRKARCKPKSESQNVPLSSLNVQQTRTGRPVLGASSSNYSEWNIDDKWSSQVWKSVEMLGASTGRPVDDKFVIDDDMDSNTATESNLSLRSRSFLNRVNDRLWKMLARSPEDVIQDIDKRSMIWWMFMSSTLEASVFMGKNYSDNLHSIKNTGEDLTFKADVRHIWKVDSGRIRWDFRSVSNQLAKFFIETIISGQCWRSHQSLACKGLCILRFCVMSWKSDSEPNIQNCLERTVWLVQRFTTIQNFAHTWRRTDGIRVEYFPRIHYIAARPGSPKVHEPNERPSASPRTNYLHVDVQWHHMVN